MAAGVGLRHVYPAEPGALSVLKALHYRVSWLDLGFVKRGLVGTIATGLLGRPPTDLEILAFWGLMAVGALLGGGVLVLSAASRIGDRRERAVWLAVTVLSPATFLHLGYDVGRLDVLLLLLFGCAFAVRGRPQLVGVAAAVGLLVHELFALALLPTLALAVLEKGGTNAGSRRGALASCAPALGPALVVLAFLAVAGPYEPGPGAFRARLAERGVELPETVRAQEAVGVWTRGLADNVERAVGALVRPRALSSVVLGAVFLLLLGAFDRRVRARWDLPRGPRTWAPYSGLLLLVLGTDVARWFALVGSALIVTLAFDLRETGGGAGRCDPAPAGSWRVADLLLAAACLLGPLGVTFAFPLPVAVFRMLGF